MKKFLILYFAANLLISPVFAVDFDLSVDDEIRKNYNPSKLEEDAALPALPNILSTENNTVPVSSTVTQKPAVQKTAVQKTVPKAKTSYKKPAQKTAARKPVAKKPVVPPQGSFATLAKGTKIRAKLTSGISDRTKKGTKITFISKYPVTTTYFTIPSGSVLHGEVIESHKPQLSGNGGLLVINVNSVIINDSTQPINAYVTKANHKKVFFNNIKGKRKYISSVGKSLQPGYHFFGKMKKVTSNLANDGSSVILTPFSVAAGLLVLGANTAISPVTALFRKGDTLYLPSGCDIEIKLTQDVFIYN